MRKVTITFEYDENPDPNDYSANVTIPTLDRDRDIMCNTICDITEPINLLVLIEQQ